MARNCDECKWIVKPAWEGRKELARQLRMPELVAQLLYNRGITEPEQARAFLHPTLKNLIDPATLIGIDAAVKRIRQALCDDEKIVIYGDYDVDGIMGVSILWQCMKLTGHEVDYYVPHRIDEGYGLNIEAVRELAEKGTNLIITVDCGITAHESADEAARLGVDLIITDHHQLDGDPARSVAVVHPDLPGQNYANTNLCGAGVAFKLAWALGQEFSGEAKVSEEFRQYLLAATSMAAMGTIADVVPLLGENRVLASYGMQGLANCQDHGIRALITAAGLDGAKLNSTDIGFKLAPRLNAAGRMGHARLAVEMFTRSSAARAIETAKYLESQNRQRQKVEKDITEEASRQVVKLKMDAKAWRGIVASGENWHGGVIGIVASRIVDKYHRPTVVISQQENKAIGSCRSIAGFNIHKALTACSEYLLGFGGHEMAAGLQIELDKIEPFRQAFNQYAAEHLAEDDLVKKLNIDAEVALAELTLATAKAIEQLGPFGAGNPSVKLVARKLRLVGHPRRIGKSNDHLALTVTDQVDHDKQLQPGNMMRAVAFGKANMEKKLIAAKTFDVVFAPTINHFNRNTTVEMMVKDFQIP